jgi:chromatin structure-remodeling complex subunit RSC9
VLGILDGPNIYERCLLALRSGIRDEQAFALYHLVKISFERGDKYKFSQFSGLAEGLTEVALTVGSIFYNVEWTISYDPEVDDSEINILDGIEGTPDILERIAQLKRKDVQDSLQPAELADQMTLITEAVLTIRNMVMLPENAWYIADSFPPINALLCILLNLPPLDMVVELKHSALDIAEQITPFLTLDADDPLYKTLLAQLESEDRGIILTALRALGRIAMNHPTQTNKLNGVPAATLQRLIDWLLLNDDELVDACLDFLYQYTAEVSNMDVLLEGTNVEHLVAHLVRLLSHGAKRTQKEYVLSEAQVSYVPATENVVPIPKDLQEQLLALEEPERCFAWLRCFFEEDPEAQITQIAIWQAYNAAFLDQLKRMGRPMINAPEFIRHISTVYQSAGAQVIREGANGEIQKFIMRGIRPRPFPINRDGRAYFQCLWQSPESNTKCNTWNLTSEAMWQHVLTDHLKETPNEEGKFTNREADYQCAWGHCTKYPNPTKLSLWQFASHIKTHTKIEQDRHPTQVFNLAQDPTTSPSSSRRSSSAAAAAAQAAAQRSRVVVKPAKSITLTFEETASARDERNPNAPPQAAGIPLSAVLILRNIALNANRTKSEEKLVRGRGEGGAKSGKGKSTESSLQKKPSANGTTGAGEAKDEEGEWEEPGGWNERLFRPVMPRLFEVFTENRLLAPHLTTLFQLLE